MQSVGWMEMGGRRLYLSVVALLAITSGNYVFSKDTKEGGKETIETKAQPETNDVENDITSCRKPGVTYPIGISMAELEKGLSDSSLVLVDVREPCELEELGEIPNSYNVPLSTFHEAFLLSPEKFRLQYGFEKPSPEDDNVALSCMAGRRIVTAWEEIQHLGYCNVRLYYGSFTEWQEEGGEVIFSKESQSSKSVSD